MITLTSRWKLRNGASPDLLKALEAMVAKIRAQEPDTLMYLVHLAARGPLDGKLDPVVPAPPPIPGAQQTEVVFIEIYRDAQAFARHVSGEIFTTFRRDYLGHFYEDPARPGWAQTVTDFYARDDGFIRMDAAC